MTPEVQTYYCSECGQPAPLEGLARFGDRLICPNCKNAYAQKLREGVAPSGAVHYGGFWWRVLAACIDTIILAIPMGIIQGAVMAGMGRSMLQIQPNPNATPTEALATIAPFFQVMGLAWLIDIVVGCTYEAFFIVKFAATPGKMAVGVQVLRPDGSKLGVGRAIGRHFAKMVSAMILCIGYLMVAFDSQKRGLHDIMCDTRVFKTRG
jgi:uncharacterized RDD family membrane protein YckC